MDAPCHDVGLKLPDGGEVGHKLTVDVGHGHGVAVDHGNVPHPAAGKGLDAPRAYASAAEDDDASLRQATHGVVA